MEINFDLSQFKERADLSVARMLIGSAAGIKDIATELLRLSEAEVPLDEGTLANSGHVEPAEDNPDDMLVGYNTAYAAYQHEGMRANGTYVVKNWQHGRKSKYLEDPMKQNNDVFMTHYYTKVEEALNA